MVVLVVLFCVVLSAMFIDKSQINIIFSRWTYPIKIICIRGGCVYMLHSAQLIKYFDQE